MLCARSFKNNIYKFSITDKTLQMCHADVKKNVLPLSKVLTSHDDPEPFMFQSTSRCVSVLYWHVFLFLSFIISSLYSLLSQWIAYTRIMCYIPGILMVSL